MENVSIHGAALKAIEWFDLNPEAMSANSGEKRQSDTPKDDTASKIEARSKEGRGGPGEQARPTRPLKFRLDKLERDHPYLAERGLTLETIVDFGLGYCAKGMMAERIAIPIHNPEGKVVAYAGRFPGEPAEDTPKIQAATGIQKGAGALQP